MIFSLAPGPEGRLHGTGTGNDPSAQLLPGETKGGELMPVLPVIPFGNNWVFFSEMIGIQSESLGNDRDL